MPTHTVERKVICNCELSRLLRESTFCYFCTGENDVSLHYIEGKLVRVEPHSHISNAHGELLNDFNDHNIIDQNLSIDEAEK